MLARVLAGLLTAFTCTEVVDPPSYINLETGSSIGESSRERVGRPHLCGEAEAGAHVNTDSIRIGVVRVRSLLGARTYPGLDFRGQPRHRRAVHPDTSRESASRFPTQKAGVAYANAELLEVGSRKKEGLGLCVHGFHSVSGSNECGAGREAVIGVEIRLARRLSWTLGAACFRQSVLLGGMTDNLPGAQESSVGEQGVSGPGLVPKDGPNLHRFAR